MIYHVNHVCVFTVVALIILKYIPPQSGLCQRLDLIQYVSRTSYLILAMIDVIRFSKLEIDFLI